MENNKQALNKLNLLLRAMAKAKGIDADDLRYQDNKTTEQIIEELNLTEEDFPHLSCWKDKEHLLRTLLGIANARGARSLRSAAVNVVYEKNAID